MANSPSEIARRSGVSRAIGWSTSYPEFALRWIFSFRALLHEQSVVGLSSRRNQAARAAERSRERPAGCRSDCGRSRRRLRAYAQRSRRRRAGASRRAFGVQAVAGTPGTTLGLERGTLRA